MKSKTRPSKMRSGVGEMAQQDEIIKDEVGVGEMAQRLKALLLLLQSS